MPTSTLKPHGSLTASPVSPVAAGNVSSGQLAIRGSGALSAACSGGSTPIVASSRPPRRLHLGLRRGSEALSSYGGRHLSRVCGSLALPQSVTRRSGASSGG